MHSRFGLVEALLDFVRSLDQKTVLYPKRELYQVLTDRKCDVFEHVSALSKSSDEVLAYAKNAKFVKEDDKHLLQFDQWSPRACPFELRVSADSAIKQEWTALGPLIHSRLCLLYEHMQRHVGLDSPRLRDCMDVLLKHQPFSYYNSDEKKQAEFPWSESWMDTLNAICNESKHIRLTQQGSTSDLASKKGLFEDRRMRLMIEVVEPRGYSFAWSFFEALRKLKAPGAQETTQVSLQ